MDYIFGSLMAKSHLLISTNHLERFIGIEWSNFRKKMQFVSTAKNFTQNFVKELEIQIWKNNLLTFQVTFFESFSS